MRALQFNGGSAADVVDVDEPPLRPDWARIAVCYNSVCGSDLWLYQGQWHGNKYPIVPGHEWVGTVTDVNGAHTEWIGRRVIGDLIHACGVCPPCRNGLPVMCESLTEIGFSVNGGCAEYVDVPVRNLYALPDVLATSAACQVEPLSVALHAVDRAGVRPAERVAVLGCGGIGLLILQGARCAGAVVELATDPVDFRSGVADGLGAAATADASDESYEALADHRFDVVFEASGSPMSVARGMDLLRPGGRLVVVGYRMGATHQFETAKLALSSLTVLGVMGPGGKYRQAISLLERGSVDVAPLLTNFVTLDDHGPALAKAINREPGTIRVVFRMADEDHD